ncbi:MAG: glycosyltransferase [Solirubrobacterales bacterium]|nr:glycosyltransferase [Solirubrobacterales bacterium]
MAVSDPRVVITHDYLETYGGAERVTMEMAAAFPEAPVVSILGRRAVAQRMGIGDRWRSVLPERERLLRQYRGMALVTPAIVDHHRVPEADVVLSSSYAFAHRFGPHDGTARVCYCHSPLRFAWSMTGEYRRRWARGPLSGAAFGAFAASMRSMDRRAAQRVDVYLTQSPYTAELILEAYGRRAEVIGAPVDCEVFQPAAGGDHGGYALLVGRMVEPYKRFDIVIEAFARTGERLMIAGDGPARAELEAMAPPNATFLGHLEDAALVEAMQRARYVVFPSRDDFGLVPLEAMACGRPVLAYDAGGARHTVVPGVTGERFPEQSADALEEALHAFEPEAYDPGEIRRHAEHWDRRRFRARLRERVLSAV